MDKKEKLIGTIVMIVGCTIFLIIGCVLSKPKSFNSEDNKDKNSVIVDNSNKTDLNKKNEDEFKEIVVEIKGEVKKPDVYRVKFGSRVNDLIKKAGGFTEKADKISVNCSMKLKDEDSIIIYNKDEKQKINLPNHNIDNSSKSKKDKININTATKEELISLPGVGEVTSNNIIDYREKNGDFNSIDELTNINRIGTKTLDKFREKIEVK